MTEPFEWTKQQPIQDGWYIVQKLDADNDLIFEAVLVRFGYASSLPKGVLYWAPIPDPPVARVEHWEPPPPEPSSPGDLPHLRELAGKIKPGG